MKHFTFYSLLIALAVITSACGAEPVPTVNAVDVQHTAEAAAFTMVAQTQAAIPTSTPLPPTKTPTQTPLPTDTPISLPTLETIVPSVAAGAGNATVDPCSTRVLSSPQGPETIIRIVNKTRVAVGVSIYLEETASHGECGYRGYNIAKANDIVITDLVQGCYYVWAWSTESRLSFRVSSVRSCINNSDKWTFEISEGSVKFVGP